MAEIIVYTGPMASEKTLNLILSAKRFKKKSRSVQCFHPEISNRWGNNEIVSRFLLSDDEDGGLLSHPSKPLTNLDNFLQDELLPGTHYVLFDDAQFFNNSIVDICRVLRKRGISVYISGLDMDTFEQPFGPMPYLMAIADKVVKYEGMCEDCYEPSKVSFRVVNNKNQIVVGSSEYVSLCFECYYIRKALQEMKEREDQDE